MIKIISTKSNKFDSATVIVLDKGLIDERQSYQGKLDLLSYLPKTGKVSDSSS